MNALVDKAMEEQDFRTKKSIDIPEWLPNEVTGPSSTEEVEILLPKSKTSKKVMAILNNYDQKSGKYFQYGFVL